MQDYLFLFYHKIQITIKQERYTKANESGEEAQKETMGLIDTGLSQSQIKVNSNRNATLQDGLIKVHSTVFTRYMVYKNRILLHSNTFVLF